MQRHVRTLTIKTQDGFPLGEVVQWHVHPDGTPGPSFTITYADHSMDRLLKDALSQGVRVIRLHADTGWDVELVLPSHPAFLEALALYIHQQYRFVVEIYC